MHDHPCGLWFDRLSVPFEGIYERDLLKFEVVVTPYKFQILILNHSLKNEMRIEKMLT